MGEADAEATRIYAHAFSKDKDFYGFWRRMEAYKQAFGAGGSTMVLSPDSDFFRYFNDPAGSRRSGQEIAARQDRMPRRRLWQPATRAGSFFANVRKRLKYISNITPSLFAPHSAAM